MSSLLTTYSKFYYGYIIDDSNFYLNFDEGSGELTAELNNGEYTFEDFATEVERALNDTGTFTYTVVTDRTSRTLTISAGSPFDLLVSTGTQAGISAFDLMGFTGADRTGASIYTSDTESGFSFSPQFMLQDYISSDNWQQAADASVNKTASGRVEIVKFGIEKFFQFSIRFTTDIDQGCNGPILNNPNGLEDLQSFMQYVTKRAPLEFMPDSSSPDDFFTITFDSSQDSTTGTGYKLKELYDKGLPGYFDTAVLKFRLRED